MPKPAKSRLMSLENEGWMNLRKAADAVLNQTLAQFYRAAGIAFRAPAYGEHGVRMSAYSTAHVLHHSDGLKSVNASLARLGVRVGGATARQQAVANFAERQGKRMFPLASFNEMWRARNESAGFPVFESGDARLEQGFAAEPGMAPAHAIDAGFALASEHAERVFNEHRLLELSIYASRFATPHALISQEIERQVQEKELVFNRGVLVRPGQVAELDSGLVAAVAAVAALGTYESAMQQIQRMPAAALSQSERDGLMSFIAGTSPETVVELGRPSPTPFSQPGSFGLSAFTSTAQAVGLSVVSLAPLAYTQSDQSDQSGQGGHARSLEAAMQSRAALCGPKDCVILEHAQDVSATKRKQLASKVSARGGRLVQLYDHGHPPAAESIPALQTTEAALRAVVQPYDVLRETKVKQEKSIQAGKENLGESQGVVQQAAQLLSQGKPVLVVTATKDSARKINADIVTSLAAMTGANTTKIRVRESKKNSENSAKLTLSYSVGDTVLIKRKTGCLNRKTVAVITAVIPGKHGKAGFLTLSPELNPEYPESKSHLKNPVTVSLAAQAHHIEPIELTDIQVTPGAVLKMTESMPSRGLVDGQTVVVKKSVDGKLHLTDAFRESGAEYQISGRSGPIPASPAIAITDDTCDDTCDRALYRRLRPSVFLSIDPGATREEVGRAVGLAHSVAMDSVVQVHATEDVLRCEISQSPPAPGISAISAKNDFAAPRRLFIRESDIGALEKLNAEIAGIERTPGTPGLPVRPLHVTLIDGSGERTLHRVHRLQRGQGGEGAISRLQSTITRLIGNQDRHQDLGPNR